MLRLIFHIILLVPLFSHSQVTIVNRSLIDSSMSFAYVGVDNAVELVGYKGDSKLGFSTTNGTLTDLGKNRFVLNPITQGECTLTFKEKEKLVAQKTFRVEIVPALVVRFSNVNDSIVSNGKTYLTISLSKFISDPVLRVYAPRCFLKQKGEISGYRITFDGAGFEDQDEILVNGSRLTETQLNMVRRRFREGTYVFVDNIRCILRDGTTATLAPLIYIIKN